MKRRQFISATGGALLASAGMLSCAAKPKPPASIKLFLGGDVMTGRGIDQAFPISSHPRLYEQRTDDARYFVERAEASSGAFTRPVSHAYPWGDAMEIWSQMRPDARIINLETSITRHDGHWPGKAIHFRMHPDNVRCLSAGGIDLCALANNHALDWGRQGLRETQETLAAAGIRFAGAGSDLQQAAKPAVLPLGGGPRLKVYSMATFDSGIEEKMAARPGFPGVWSIPRLSPDITAPLLERIRSEKQAGDIVVASIHWGGNWGYHIPADQRRFARALIAAGVDVIHGHSAHHRKGIEIIDGRAVLYGCGDLINDYEGIKGDMGRFRNELVLMYFLTLDAHSGALQELRMRPMRIRRFRLNHASIQDAEWLTRIMHTEGQRLNTAVWLEADGWMALDWAA